MEWLKTTTQYISTWNSQSVSKPQYKHKLWIQYVFIRQCCQQFELWAILSSSCDTSVGTETRLWAEWPAVLFLRRTRHFYTLQNVWTGSGAHPASYSVVTKAVNWLGLKMTIQLQQVSGLGITSAVPLLLLHVFKVWSKKCTFFIYSIQFRLSTLYYTFQYRIPPCVAHTPIRGTQGDATSTPFINCQCIKHWKRNIL